MNELVYIYAVLACSKWDAD